jgi:hypothetical protein
MIERSDGWLARRDRRPDREEVHRRRRCGGRRVQAAYWGFFSVLSLLLALVSMLCFAFHSDHSPTSRLSTPRYD